MHGLTLLMHTSSSIYYRFCKCTSCFFLVGYSLFRYKFDDERVTKEDMKKALEEQYGGEEEVTHSL